jgi:predicted Zn-dependent peptidase
MKTIRNDYHEHVVEFSTPSGLSVTVVVKPEFINQAVIIGTPFGGLSTSALINGEQKEFAPGLAHFLEHQLFENDLGSIMSDFTDLGANVNAFTSYSETAYYFSTTNDLQAPLALLLDMVHSTSITEASTQKEKGIIIQELNMYDQMPESILIKSTFSQLYRNHPLRNDIGGSNESVSGISHDDLNEAYTYFYHPSAMNMVVVTHQPVEKVKAWIDSHPFSSQQKDKTTITWNSQMDTFDHLPQTTSIFMDVNQNKVTVTLPITPTSSDPKRLLKQQWAIKVLLEGHFSEINPKLQDWMDQGIINELFDYDVDVEVDYAHVMFLFENINPAEASEFVVNQLDLIQVDMNLLTQLKRRWLFSSLRVFNRPTSIMSQILHYKLKGIRYFDVLEAINGLTLEDLKKAQVQLKQTLTSVVEVKKDPNL